MNCKAHSRRNAGANHRLTAGAPASRGAFTLIELILVMTVLTIAVSTIAPALSSFFRGRSLDSEARRLLALVRQGQSRAVSEGVPMELWFNTKLGVYGLEAEPSYEENDSRALEFVLDGTMALSVEAGTGLVTPRVGSSAAQAGTVPVLSRHPDLPRIRFMPDGSLDENSPIIVILTGIDDFKIGLSQTRNRMTYEIVRANN